MIIRIRKIHVFLFASVLVLVSFVIALSSEGKNISASSENGIKLPVVMYHHVTESASKTGKYVVSTDELEKDLIYLKEKGYETVDVNDIIEYVNGEKFLPEKIIMITFDDGFKSIHKLAWPLLKKHNMKAVVAAVGTITDEYTKNQNTNINYAYLTWDELKELNESNEFEVQSHTFNMHNLSKDKNSRNGMAKMNGETEEEYKKAIVSDLTKMQDCLLNNSNITATAIAYPYGLYSKSTLDIIKELGFKSNFLCEEKISTIIKGDTDSLYNLGRFNRQSGIPTEEFFAKMKIE